MLSMLAQELAKTHRSEFTDNELVQQTLAGDESAFEILVERYHAVLNSWVYQILRNRYQVDDVLQYVFLQLFLSLATLHTDRSLKAWLFRVAHNRCVDELRRMRPISFSELTVSEDVEDEFVPFEFIPDPGPLPEEMAERHELQQRVLRAIRALPSRLRSVVFLRYTSQKSFSEIGQMLNIPEATAKTYFNRAKPFLRSALTQEQVASAC
jgi:RNA polymerase sigma-70 factor (ECF subfamily)